MKKLLLATTAAVVLAAASANAADLSRPAYAPPPPAYSWTGFYWGLNIGYSWGTFKREYTETIPGFGTGTTSESQSMNGVIGGFQSGYNYQFGNWAWGLETDIQASGQKGSTTYCFFASCAVSVAAEHKLPWFGTARSRLGILWSPAVLVYGTAGAAFGQVKSSYVENMGNVTVATLNTNNTRAGWTAGAGIEGALGGGWSAKLEYLYIDLGKQTGNSATVVGTAASWSERTTDNIVRVGLNYKWGGY